MSGRQLLRAKMSRPGPKHPAMGWPLTDDRLRMEHGRLLARIRKLDRKGRKVQEVAMCVLELIVVERLQEADEAMRVIVDEPGARGNRARKALRSITKEELQERTAKMAPGSGIVLPAGVRL